MKENLSFNVYGVLGLNQKYDYFGFDDILLVFFIIYNPAPSHTATILISNSTRYNKSFWKIAINLFQRLKMVYIV